MKKKHKILHIVTISIIAIFAILLGYVGGSFIANKHFTFNKYAGITADELRDDFSKIKYEGKTPDQLTPVEAYLVAIAKLKTLDYYQRNSFGDIQTSLGVNQTTHSRNTKNGNLFTQEFCTVSSIIKNAGVITFEENCNVTINYGKPNGKTIDDVEWGKKTETYTFEEFSEKLGQNPTIETPYIVSTKTILNEGTCTKNSNNTYTFTLILEPNLCNICTVNKMAFLSGIDKNTIEFTKVEIEFTMDSNFSMINEIYYEDYTLKYGGLPVQLTSNYNATYKY